MEYSFILNKKAKSKGGDKYICSSNNDWNIYFPQEISRNNEGEPKQIIKINFN